MEELSHSETAAKWVEDGGQRTPIAKSWMPLVRSVYLNPQGSEKYLGSETCGCTALAASMQPIVPLFIDVITVARRVRLEQPREDRNASSIYCLFQGQFY
jgi:hypothetical protein